MVETWSMRHAAAPEKRKTKSVRVNMTAAHHDALTAIAERFGLSVASWLLTLGLRETDRLTPKALGRPPVPKLPKPPKPCPICRGTGKKTSGTRLEECFGCDGTGILRPPEGASKLCGSCHGRGSTAAGKCTNCSGTGAVLDP